MQAIWTHLVARTEFPQQGQTYLRLLDGFVRRRCGIAVVTACARDRDTVMLVSCNENIGQVIFENKIQQFFAGMRTSPTVLGVMLHNQAMGFRNLFKAFVVVQI